MLSHTCSCRQQHPPAAICRRRRRQRHQPPATSVIALGVPHGQMAPKYPAQWFGHYPWIPCYAKGCSKKSGGPVCPECWKHTHYEQRNLIKHQFNENVSNKVYDPSVQRFCIIQVQTYLALCRSQALGNWKAAVERAGMESIMWELLPISRHCKQLNTCGRQLTQRATQTMHR